MRWLGSLMVGGELRNLTTEGTKVFTKGTKDKISFTTEGTK